MVVRPAYSMSVSDNLGRMETDLSTRSRLGRRQTAFIGVFLGVGLGAAARLDMAAALAALMIVVGLAGALRLRAGAVSLLGLAAVGGLIVGAAAAEATPGLSVALFSLGGAIATASVLSYGVLATRRLDLEWGRIARRAGASWIAAIGLMVLALSFVPPTRHG